MVLKRMQKNTLFSFTQRYDLDLLLLSSFYFFFFFYSTETLLFCFTIFFFLCPIFRLVDVNEKSTYSNLSKLSLKDERATNGYKLTRDEEKTEKNIHSFHEWKIENIYIICIGEMYCRRKKEMEKKLRNYVCMH